jgi:hypothetical protein
MLSRDTTGQALEQGGDALGRDEASSSDATAAVGVSANDPVFAGSEDTAFAKVSDGRGGVSEVYRFRSLVVVVEASRRDHNR